MQGTWNHLEYNYIGGANGRTRGTMAPLKFLGSQRNSTFAIEQVLMFYQLKTRGCVNTVHIVSKLKHC